LLTKKRTSLGDEDAKCSGKSIITICKRVVHTFIDMCGDGGIRGISGITVKDIVV
jgi:hypothetical protein